MSAILSQFICSIQTVVTNELHHPIKQITQRVDIYLSAIPKSENHKTAHKQNKQVKNCEAAQAKATC